jgi:signal transduction histidine kinase/CheY-like chemotaxis protein
MIEQKILLLLVFLPQPGALGLLGGLGVGVPTLILGWVMSLRWMVRRKTEQLQKEQANDAALREAAELANRAKAQFLANMSHEIRTPMNAVIGFTDLALKGNLNDELREYLDTIRTSADWLIHIVNDVFEFSRIEAGKLQLEKTTFCLTDCVRSTIKIVQPEAAAKALMLRYKMDGQIPNLVSGDPVRFRQILFHLLDNAVKFTTCGSVMLTASLDSKSSDAVLIRISVADTGIGIPIEKQPYIFEPFRPDGIADYNLSSSGLGLAIARKLVEMMGGKIEFTSQIGAGTTFEFTAWFGKAQRAPELSSLAAAVAGAPARQLSILVAEDNAVSRKLIVKVLESAGHRVVAVSNGKEAVNAFATEIFDLILMDMEMPDMDGLEATRTIRLHEPKGSHIAIYAVTAHSTQTDREQCLGVGMDGFMAKPIEIEEVLKAVTRVASTSAARAAIQSSAPLSELQPASVDHVGRSEDLLHCK